LKEGIERAETEAEEDAAGERAAFFTGDETSAQAVPSGYFRFSCSSTMSWRRRES